MDTDFDLEPPRMEVDLDSPEFEVDSDVDVESPPQTYTDSPHPQSNMDVAHVKMETDSTLQSSGNSAFPQMEMDSVRPHIGSTPQHAFFQCDICDKQFTKKQNMQRHRIAHSDVREYECRECDARFHRKDQLQDHSFSHFKSKELDCAVLGCSFITQSPNQLRTHMIVQHGVSLKNPAACKHCSKLFRSCRSLMIHYHAEEPRPCGTKLANSQEVSNTPPTCNEEAGKLPSALLDYIQKCVNLNVLGTSFNNEDIFNSFTLPQVVNANAAMHSSYDINKVKSEIPQDEQSGAVEDYNTGTVKTDKLTDLQERGSPGNEDVHRATELDDTFSSEVSAFCTEQLKSIFAEHSYSAAEYANSNDEETIVVDSERVQSVNDPETTSSNSGNNENAQGDRCDSVKSTDSIPLGGSATPVEGVDNQEENHECPVCRITYHDTAMYIMHMGFHTLGDPFRCNMCGLKSESRYEFNGHLMYGNHNSRRNA